MNIYLCNLGIWSTRSDSKRLLHHDRDMTLTGAFNVLMSKRVTHLMTDHILAILFEREFALWGTSHPSVRVKPYVCPSKNSTGQLVFYTPSVFD